MLNIALSFVINFNSYKNKSGEIVYQDDEITVRNFGDDPEVIKIISDFIGNTYTSSSVNDNTISPFSTVGPGGRSELSATTNNRPVYWMIKPKTK
ncbi:hypothetical protein [Bacillus mesophilum]|uniref:Uncharacterized protein n=1 Tax=Bacillus mesophilum TaxID=1071718 RepID=A0A7V7RI22_9BACI|nr:hypothetical protein [Bacillus mesophilum]KAB2329482.1 hypothetical protein F7732_21390 [Bacillus mesophilum]